MIFHTGIFFLRLFFAQYFGGFGQHGFDHYSAHYYCCNRTHNCPGETHVTMATQDVYMVSGFMHESNTKSTQDCSWSFFTLCCRKHVTDLKMMMTKAPS